MNNLIELVQKINIVKKNNSYIKLYYDTTIYKDIDYLYGEIHNVMKNIFSYYLFVSDADENNDEFTYWSSVYKNTVFDIHIDYLNDIFGEISIVFSYTIENDEEIKFILDTFSFLNPIKRKKTIVNKKNICEISQKYLNKKTIKL
jgi:hypothetical protein